MAPGTTGAVTPYPAKAEAPPLPAQPCRYTIRRRQPVDGAARQHYGVHCIHEVFGLERIGLARSGSAAAHIHRANRALVGEDDRHAGDRAQILRLAHPHPRHVGDQVQGAGACSLTGHLAHAGTVQRNGRLSIQKIRGRSFVVMGFQGRCMSLVLPKPVRILIGLLAVGVLPSGALAATTNPILAPHGMVAAANPLAAKAGLKILKEGGSAVDAAVAIQAVLGLVEPQSSGLGGGAFMTYYDAKSHKTVVYNGREVAPAAATSSYFLGADGKPLSFVKAVLSGRSTGVLGAIPMLGAAHKAHGKLGWSHLFGDAEKLANEGFIISPRLGEDIVSRFPQASTPDSIAYFTKLDGTKFKTGDTLKNPAYAATLKRLAAEGPDALMKGKIAADIIAKTHAEPAPEGLMTAADLAAYRATADEPVCRPYRAYVVCGPPAPGGGLGVLEILGILESTDIATRGPTDPQAWVEFAEASRLAYADRDHYVGDPRFVKVPAAGLLDPAYDAARAKLMDTDGVAKGTPPFGTPTGASGCGPRPHARARRHHQLRHRRQGRQCGLHDHDGGKHLWVGTDGRRLLPE